MENNLASTTSTLNRYSLNRAQRCIAYYKDRASVNGITGSKQIKAYLVRKEDILESLGITSIPVSTYDYFRVYIGLEDRGEESDPAFKLFLTPVKNVGNPNAAGEDVILNGRVQGEEGDVDYVMDFNTPCPNTCDTNSPLYLAGERI